MGVQVRKLVAALVVAVASIGMAAPATAYMPNPSPVRAEPPFRGIIYTAIEVDEAGVRWHCTYYWDGRRSCYRMGAGNAMTRWAPMRFLWWIR